MRKHLLFCVVWVILAVSCSVLKKGTDSEYFEGIIKYKLTYQSLNPMISDVELSRQLGDELVFYIAEDKYAMVRNTGGHFGTTITTYLLDEGIGFIEYEKSDTLYKFDITRTSEKLIDVSSIITDQATILNRKCHSIEISYSPQNGMVEEVRTKFYFDPNIKLNQKKYKKHKEGFMDVYAEKTGAISLKNEILNKGFFSSVQEAVTITPQKMEDRQFLPDSEKIIVDIR